LLLCPLCDAWRWAASVVIVGRLRVIRQGAPFTFSRRLPDGEIYRATIADLGPDMTIRFVFLIVAAAPNSNYSAGFIAVKLNLLVGALCLATTASSLIAYIHLT